MLYTSSKMFSFFSLNSPFLELGVKIAKSPFVKVSNCDPPHMCKFWFGYLKSPTFSQPKQFCRNWAKMGGHTWGRPSRPLYVAPSTVEIRLPSMCTRYAMLCTTDCYHVRFLVQGKRNLAEKFQKKLSRLGGCPHDPLKSDREQTPRTWYEHPGPNVW